MTKNKKIQEKVRQYYRGPVRRPIKIADELDMKIIEEALIQCLPVRSKSAFKVVWNNHDVQVKIVVGLKATVRHLKRKELLALVLDDTCPDHMANLLIEFAHKLAIPIIKAQGLLRLASKLNLNTVQAFCLIDTAKLDAHKYDEGDPRPRPVESVIEIEAFNQFAALLQAAPKSEDGDKYKFREPHVDLVKSTGRSKAKKVTKKMKLS